jgi:hypothetical protein
MASGGTPRGDSCEFYGATFRKSPYRYQESLARVSRQAAITELLSEFLGLRPTYGRLLPTEMATAREFIEAAVEELPEAREDVESFEGLPYVQIGILAEIAQRAKGAGDWRKFQQVVDFVDRFLPEADGELRNAIHVSFLEHIDFIGPRGAQAWELMSPRLRSAWRDIITYNEELLGRPWPQGKVKPWLTKPHKGR